MGKRITLLQGHPSRQLKHLCHALADAYADAAKQAGHEVRRIEVGQLEFPAVRSAEEWKSAATLPAALRESQEAIAWAEHLVIVFPLWTGTMPAHLKAFFEQVARPGAAFVPKPAGGLRPAWTNKSARVVVTMGMPALFYRLIFGAQGVRFLRRGLLGMCGIGPMRATYIGSVDGKKFSGAKWLEEMRALGRAAR